MSVNPNADKQARQLTFHKVKQTSLEKNLEIFPVRKLNFVKQVKTIFQKTN